MTNELSLFDKLSLIQTELKVKKEKRNAFGGFDYRSAEDILEAIKPFLKKYNLVLLLKDDVVCVGDRYYIKATATLRDDKREISVDALARESDTPKAKMDFAQTTGSTSSYARKYALNGLFCIDEGKDNDVQEDFSEVETINDLDELKKYYLANINNVKNKKEFDAVVSNRKETLEKELNAENENI